MITKERGAPRRSERPVKMVVWITDEIRRKDVVEWTILIVESACMELR